MTFQVGFTTRDIRFFWDEQNPGGPFQFNSQMAFSVSHKFVQKFNKVINKDFLFDPNQIALTSCTKKYESGDFACIEGKKGLHFATDVII